MAGRKGQLNAEQQTDLGQAVVIGRACGMTWKQLEDHYGMSRRQLWRYVLASKMSHNSSKMSHQGCCAET